MDKDKLSDNWRFTDNNKPVDEMSFNAYVEKYGEERALGYLDAIADVKAEVEWMLQHWRPDEGGWNRTESKTTKMLKDFKKHKDQFVQYMLNHSICDRDTSLVEKLKQR